MEEDKEKEEPIAPGMDEDDEEKDVSAENETKEGVTGIPHISHYRRQRTFFFQPAYLQISITL